ncbi:2-haloacid dehalogenase [Pseudooceanicola antarcticus]|uniref:Haloacid dehalogenase n=1 Tax=Pseudooceanicola antarcticus TaxID=1247613 RepID=A0A285HJG1_9RHOB|nr:HAD-IA family hydrolase [Pseudooceanicola antarcticus]PJE27925.1 haloacid dehalogenase [Pseudooceanicola antarcticus]SNY35879.1 2-haloacid dehalogenase [Pseudooceanicola antarcticus]
MTQAPIKAVVFDIGNVLVEWHPEAHYDRKFGEERRREIFANVDLHAMNDRVDRGGDLEELAARLAEDHPEYREEILTWHADWLTMCAPPIPHSWRLLRALRAKGIPVFSLTNFGKGTYRTAAAEYEVLNEFDQDYISGHMEVIKPDPRIYEMLEEGSGLSGASLIFTDDRADNIAAAAARGWRTHLFEGPEGWAARLVAEGLLTEEEAA